jgi:hypothetical protein
VRDELVILTELRLQLGERRGVAGLRRITTTIRARAGGSRHLHHGLARSAAAAHGVAARAGHAPSPKKSSHVVLPFKVAPGFRPVSASFR